MKREEVTEIVMKIIERKALVRDAVLNDSRALTFHTCGQVVQLDHLYICIYMGPGRVSNIEATVANVGRSFRRGIKRNRQQAECRAMLEARHPNPDIPVKATLCVKC